MSPNNKDSSDKDDLDDPSSVPKKYHLINWSYLAWKEGGRYKRKPIGNREEYDSSSASNIPRRWNNCRGGTPGEMIEIIEIINVKKLEYK